MLQHFNHRIALQTLLLATTCLSTHVIAGADETEVYMFSYVFESGGVLEGTFEGRPYSGRPSSVFQDTVIFLPSPASATYTEPSGFSFTWDTSLPTHSTSQVSLISPGEFAFVSMDGSKMDIAFAAGDTLLFLENGIQNQGLLNNASTTNLLSTDLSEPFNPSHWSLTRVPEPSALVLSVLTVFSWLARHPKRYL